jgi:hypothetical protein
MFDILAAVEGMQICYSSYTRLYHFLELINQIQVPVVQGLV